MNVERMPALDANHLEAEGTLGSHQEVSFNRYDLLTYRLHLDLKLKVPILRQEHLHRSVTYSISGPLICSGMRKCTYVSCIFAFSLSLSRQLSGAS